MKGAYKFIHQKPHPFVGIISFLECAVFLSHLYYFSSDSHHIFSHYLKLLKFFSFLSSWDIMCVMV